MKIIDGERDIPETNQNSCPPPGMTCAMFASNQYAEGVMKRGSVTSGQLGEGARKSGLTVAHCRRFRDAANM